MSTYGFKLLEIQLFRGRGRTPLDFGNPEDAKTNKISYLDRLIVDFPPSADAADAAPPAIEPEDEEVVIPETDEEVEIGSDDLVAEDPDSGTPEDKSKRLAIVRIVEAKRYVSAVLLDTVYGLVGDHSLAIDPEGKLADTDISMLATTRHYRALVIAPESGKNGFLAVEVVSRSHAGARLASRLHAGAKNHPFKIRTFGAVADDDSVKELMNGARIPEVNLYQTVSSEDAATPRTMQAKLTFKIGKGSPEEDSLRTRLLPWLPTKANKNKKTKPNPATEANSLASWLWPKLADKVSFETAEVVVEGRNRTKRLKPLDMTEGFTYDVGDVRPDDDTFVAHISDVVNSIAATNQVNLPDGWSSPVE